MVDKTSHMFITGPDVIKEVTGEDVGMEELGGAHTHNSRSGVAHFQAADEADCLELARALLSHLPSNNLDVPPAYDEVVDLEAELDPELDTFIPDSPNTPYDMHRVIERILDDGDFLEVHAQFAMNMICGFGRVDGRSVGVVANQPMHFAGTLDIDASEKAARFVRTCDAFNIPVLTFVDVPGLPAGNIAGVGRHHPARRQAHLRLLRGHGAEGDRHHPEGLRRRLRRHGIEAPACRHQPGVAHRRDRGDGRAGRGEYHLSP
jgi:propionyl-CoA carboxylase beta chain